MMAVTSTTELQPVVRVLAQLQALITLAKTLKPETTVEPPLPADDIVSDVDALRDALPEDSDESLKFGILENAARQVFYSLVSSTDIADSTFVDIWNLLDIVTLSGDRSICGPELACYLIEELLDSQTTEGCKYVFDYLESRRERLAAKDFHKKNIILLRACNELLRRLSRAEDAVFCGRVFFFLFQTFPLGDKSSVNPRGEFHTENTTKFESTGVTTNADGDQANGDAEGTKVAGTPKAQTLTPRASTPQPPITSGSKALAAKAPKKVADETLLSNDQLYPIFWHLQQDFCDPTRLFAADNFETFKKGLASTLVKFRKTPTVMQTKGAEDGKRGVKRKLGDINGNASEQPLDKYNPKYLTSRELFDLELSDLAFQRHIMVQALILIDFLISLTDKAKRKIATLEAESGTKSNKSVLYAFTLNKDDTEWATTTRSAIKTYLTSTADGRMFDRMVDTVLARDRNWVRWKVESCPSIVRDPVTTEEELEARRVAREYTKPRHVAKKVRGAIDLSFLEEGSGGGLEALKDPSRFTVPSIAQLLDGIQNDRLDLDMAMDDDEKATLETTISNKTWRALRQARESDVDLLDRVEPGQDLEQVFRPTEPRLDESEDAGGAVDGDGDAAAIRVGEGSAMEGVKSGVLESNGNAAAGAISVV